MLYRSFLISCFLFPGLVAADYVSEAALPSGWPAPGEPGVISVVELPAYRAAEGPGFWPLFAHISMGGIAMTAPVTMPAGNNPESGIGTMRFLYPSTETEKGPETDAVRVIDVQPQVVLRLSWRGKATNEQRAAYREKLEAAARDQGLEVVGEPSWFGYNSPRLASDKRTWEIALPVRSQASSSEK